MENGLPGIDRVDRRATEFRLPITVLLLDRFDDDIGLATGRLADAGTLLGVGQFANELPERYARWLAVDERVGRHHVGEEFNGILILRQLHEGVERRERAPGSGTLFVERVEGPPHRGELQD